MMIPTDRLRERGVTERTLDIAIANTERVLAVVIQNASKNVTNAQAMKGNTSQLADDLKTMYAIRNNFGSDSQEEKKPRGRPKKEDSVEDLEALIAPVDREGKQE